jgi:pre-mRNA-splicing factor RBM22/SLT11
MLDLKYSLPVEVRDNFKIPGEKSFSDGKMTLKSLVGKEFALNEAKKNDKLQNNMFENHPGHNVLINLTKPDAHYQRNQARICSFFVKGCCNRGLECPFRHSVPLFGQITRQNYHDRYNGINDLVAHKILSRVANMSTVNPPNDKNIKTIFIGNVTPRITAQMLNEKLYFYGEIKTIRMLYKRNCAFVTFCSRSEAENAILSVSSCIVIEGLSLAIRWGKNQRLRIVEDYT